MNKTIHKVCVWSVVAALPPLGLGLVLARLFPPVSPGESAIEVAQYYADHDVRIQVGLVLAALAAALMIPFLGAIAWEVQKMTGGRRALSSMIQVICGTTVFLFVLIPLVLFMAASFRADRSPEVVQALHDVGWLLFVGPTSSAIVQFAFLGVTILMDEQETPTFPRWFGYATLFFAADLLGGAFIVLTETGPFAWNGALAYYLPFATFFAWIAGAVAFLLPSVDREWAATR